MITGWNRSLGGLRLDADNYEICQLDTLLANLYKNTTTIYDARAKFN